MLPCRNRDSMLAPEIAIVVPHSHRYWYNPATRKIDERLGMIRLRVREVATEKGFSMSRLSREANMAYKTIQTICRAPYHEATTTTLHKLATTLAVTPSQLIHYSPAK